MNERRRPDDDGLTPQQQLRLEAWLDAARNADLSSLDGPPSAAPLRRALHVQRLGEMIAAAPQRRAKGPRWHSAVTWGAAAAGMLLMVFAARWAELGPFRPAPGAVASVSEPTASLRQLVGSVVARHPDGTHSILSANATVAAGDELSTTAGGFASVEVERARLDLSSATTLQLETLDRDTQVVRLHAGRVDVSVPALPGSKKRVLKIETADSVVTVLGTAFSVEFAHVDGAPATSVSVTRGVVAVERGDRHVTLRAGERWSSRGPEEAPPTSADPPEELREPADDTSAASRPRRVVASPPPEPPSESSQLAAQNRLFEQALQARDQGDDQLAAARLRQLLAEHPNTPLRSTARVELRAATKRLAEAAD